MKHLRSGDLLLILLSLLIILLVSFRVYQSSERKPEIHVRVGNELRVYDIDQDRTITVEGPIGETTIIIDDAQVHVHESPCREKICIAAGEISQTGEWIICLPNTVFITIEGAPETGTEVDDVAF
ncbi:MAG: NusG domain II-containing protein [Spirochaetia bacterium]|nr:NusG domain II-containing protein [Spirochaetia bacterium]MCF7941266.1 NusG domain II-containing protein [Spirochaetia bacterium]